MVVIVMDSHYLSFILSANIRKLPVENSNDAIDSAAADASPAILESNHVQTAGMIVDLALFALVKTQRQI